MPTDVEPRTTTTSTRTWRVRAAHSGRRLLVALIVLLAVPGVVGVAALNYQAPGPVPAATAEPTTP